MFGSLFFVYMYASTSRMDCVFYYNDYVIMCAIGYTILGAKILRAIMISVRNIGIL